MDNLQDAVKGGRDAMSAKEYLSRAYRVDQRINKKLEQVASLRELASKATSTYRDSPTNNAHDIRAREKIIARIVDLENEINRDIDILITLKKEITDVIRHEKNPEHQMLLEFRYLCFIPWEEISIEMGYSLRHVTRLHNQALASVHTKMS